MTPRSCPAFWLLPLIGLASPAARGVELEYTYGEVRAVASAPEGADEAQGVAAALSAILSRNLFAVARYASTDGDDPLSIETETAELGVGLRFPFTPTVDLVGLAGLAYADERGGRNDTDFGGVVSAGGRVWLSPRFEAGARLRYLEIFGDGDMTLMGDVLCHLTDHLSLAAGAEVSDDERGLTLGARWSF